MHLAPLALHSTCICGLYKSWKQRSTVPDRIFSSAMPSPKPLKHHSKAATQCQPQLTKILTRPCTAPYVLPLSRRLSCTPQMQRSGNS